MFDHNKYLTYKQFFLESHNHSFEIIDGDFPIMISAPHSVSQTRNNKIKVAEPSTGVLAKMLHDELNCPIIYKTKNCDDDANYDKKSPYKDALLEYIRKHQIMFLIDLHQLSPTRDIIIDLGTGGFKNVNNMDYINVFIKAFSKRNIGIIQIDKPFKASMPYTISSYISSRSNIPCLQLEMNTKVLSTLKIEMVFEALKEIMIELSYLLGVNYEKAK